MTPELSQAHQHEHEHDHQAVPAEPALRVKALESLLVEKGLVDRAALDALVDAYEHKIGPRNGARVIARAWVEPAYKQRLLTDADAAIAEWPQHIGAFKGKGLITGYLFFDRAANHFLSITLWESEEAQSKNATSPEQLHGRAEFMKHLTGAPVPATYQVAAVVTYIRTAWGNRGAPVSARDANTLRSAPLD